MTESMQEIVQLARTMETDGRDLYTRASEQATCEMARRFFLSLAQDEERHLAIIEAIGNDMGIDVDSMPSPAERIRTVFSGISDRELSETAATAREQDAIEMAMAMEKESYSLYDRAAAEAGSDQAKALLERLKLEENQHYEMLRNTAEYLNDNKKWFLNTEDGLLTGDLSSLG